MPLRLHVSTLFVLLTLRPYTLSILAWITWIAMVALHELGHGLLARREGGRVIELAVHGLGGECSYAGVSSQEGLERVAWGGVLAQSLLLVSVLALRWAGVAVPPEVVHVAVTVNLWSIAFNLLPIAPLDGALAWALPVRWWRRARARRAAARREAAQRAADAEDKKKKLAELEQRAAKLEAADHVTDTREADELLARVLKLPTDSDKR
jgi:Zn-dependent protease